MNKNQSREEKFKRLATKRLENAVKSLRLIGNLSNKSHYLYTKDDANLIIKTLKEEMNNTISQFKIAVAREEKQKFKF